MLCGKSLRPSPPWTEATLLEVFLGFSHRWKQVQLIVATPILSALNDLPKDDFEFPLLEQITIRCDIDSPDSLLQYDMSVLLQARYLHEVTLVDFSGIRYDLLPCHHGQHLRISKLSRRIHQ